MNNILEIRDLYKNYKGKPALNAVNLDIPRGRIVGLLGPNGSGKTTLIKIINGLLTANSGYVSVAGMPVGVESKKIVSYLPDKVFLDLGSSVRKTLELYQDFFEDFKIDRALSMLNSLGIEIDAKIKTLSKGNQEKVGLILTMSRDAQLYILDEPIAGVDPATRDYILRTIISNYNPNASIIISTHLIADVESVLSDVIFINQGSIVLVDTVDNIRLNEGKSIDDYFREVFRC